MPAPAAPLVRVERGGVEEAIHLGHLATVDAAARVQASVGNPDRLTYFRSCAKPFQAIAALRTGIVPYHEPAATLARRAMEQPLPIFNNCSGKHAGMLAGALALGAPLETYLDREHPIQQRIAAVIAEFTAQSPADIRFGIDGCSAPNPAVPLAAIARSFAALVTSRDDHAATVVDAMTTHPFLIGGTDRFDTRLMEVTEGRLLAKGGAAGAHCSADRRSGLGLAIKLDSGDGTWIAVAVMAALERLGWLEDAEREALDSFRLPSVRNHKGVVVGSVRPVLAFVTAA
ncbi:MAG: asparaginase [Chloroflexi bacterium]|nr:MAG: asparaginase [Chloroflexota bacterium]